MAEEPPPPDPTDDSKPRRRGRGSVVALEQPPPLVSGEAVELAEQLLRMAKAGELVDLVAVWSDNYGATEYDRTSIEYGAGILGELVLVSDEISEAVRDE